MPILLFGVERFAHRGKNRGGKNYIVLILYLLLDSVNVIGDDLRSVSHPFVIIGICLRLSSQKVIGIEKLLESIRHLFAIRKLRLGKFLSEQFVKALHRCHRITRVKISCRNGITDVVKVESLNLGILFKQFVIVFNKKVLHLHICGVDEYVFSALLTLKDTTVVIIHDPIGVLCNDTRTHFNANVEILGPRMYLDTVFLAQCNECRKIIVINYVILSIRVAWREVGMVRNITDVRSKCGTSVKKCFEENEVYTCIFKFFNVFLDIGKGFLTRSIPSGASGNRLALHQRDGYSRTNALYFTVKRLIFYYGGVSCGA